MAGPCSPSAASESAQADVILASSSPRRRDLLSKAGIAFTVRVPSTPVDETLDPADWGNPRRACMVLAERKAAALVREIAAEKRTGTLIVIGADTMVAKGTQTFGKPKDAADAARMLRELSGCTHEVVTAVSLWTLPAHAASGAKASRCTLADTSRVTFKDLSDEDIADYLDTGESFDKAGAYAVQGHGAALVNAVEGSLDTVIGLPTELLLPYLTPFSGKTP